MEIATNGTRERLVFERLRKTREEKNDVILRKKHAKASLLVMLVLMFSVIAAACGGTEIQTVEVIKEVTKEVPVEVIKEVPVEVIKEVEKIVEVIAEREKRELVFAGLNWDSALVQNGVARYIVENGYGYPTTQIEGGTVPLFQGLRNGDIDITMEIWLPNQNAAWNEATKDGEVFSVGRSLEDNWQSTFIIPGYTADANPGLVNVQDLKKDEYKSLFTEADSGGKAVLIGCIASWSCRSVNEGQIEAYGLSDHVELRDPGTAGALAAAIEGAFLKEDPLLFYYWGPTKLAFNLDFRRLEQPDPSECADNDPVNGCEFPAANILVAMNTALYADAPELVGFFKNWDWSAGNQLAADGWYGDNKDDYDSSEEAYSATGVWYLKNNDAWKTWVPADILANVEAALANES